MDLNLIYTKTCGILSTLSLTVCHDNNKGNPIHEDRTSTHQNTQNKDFSFSQAPELMITIIKSTPRPKIGRKDKKRSKKKREKGLKQKPWMLQMKIIN